MTFFGRILSWERRDAATIEIPKGSTLTLLMVSLEVPSTYRGGLSALNVTIESSHGTQCFQLCAIGDNVPNCPIQAKFSHEDSPIVLSMTNKQRVHITGRIEKDNEKEEKHGEEDEKENEEEDEEEDEKENEKREKQPKKAKRKMKTVDESQKASTGKLSRTNAKKARKLEKEEESSALAKVTEWANAEAKAKVSPKVTYSLPQWKIKPENDEGVAVWNPTPINVNGIVCTDFIVGKGKVPKMGAIVKVIYQAIIPEDGKVFDQNLKRSKPTVFRKGVGEVVRGMDLGIETMRIGGSREVVIPPELG